MGMRAEESPARSKLTPWRRNDRNSPAGREWFDWLPIHGLTTPDSVSRHTRSRPVSALGLCRRHVETELRVLHSCLARRSAPRRRASPQPLPRILRARDAHRPNTTPRPSSQSRRVRVAERPLEFWAQALGGGSSCVVPLSSLGETRDAALQCESGGEIDRSRATFRTIRHDRHPMGRWVDLVAPNAVRPENARIRIPAPAPKYGRDTSRVLRRPGYGDDEIAILRKRRIVADRWSERYLPE